MLTKAFAVLTGVLVLSSLLALGIAGYVSTPIVLPPPDIDFASGIAPVSLTTYLDQMDTWATAALGRVAVESPSCSRHDFDTDERWEVERCDRDQNGFFEEVTYDIDDDGQKDYLRIDANQDQKFESDELYRRVDTGWMRDAIPIAEIKLLDDQIAAQAGCIEQTAHQIRYDFNCDGQVELVERDTDGDGRIDAREYDIDDDGQFDYQRLGVNQDGVLGWDEVYANVAGFWRTVYSTRPFIVTVDRRPLLQTLERVVAMLKGLAQDAAQKATVRLVDGTQAIMRKYDLDGDGRSDVWTVDLDRDGSFETVLFDLSGDRRADYAWRDANRNGRLEEAEILEYNEAQGWTPLFPDVLPFPMPFPALYLP